jgi:hypothetical protein
MCAIEGTAERPGTSEAYEAIEVLPEVREFVGPETELLGFDVRYVRPDGNIDLTADGIHWPEVRYTFQRPSEPEAIEVEVMHPAWVYRREVSADRYHAGMERRPAKDAPSTPAGEPRCSLTALWRQAIEAGAPKDGFASVTFDHDGYDRVSAPRLRRAGSGTVGRL